MREQMKERVRNGIVFCDFTFLLFVCRRGEGEGGSTISWSWFLLQAYRERGTQLSLSDPFPIFL